MGRRNLQGTGKENKGVRGLRKVVQRVWSIEGVNLHQHTLMTKHEFESGISKGDAERTSSIKKQNRDILGMVLCKERHHM